MSDYQTDWFSYLRLTNFWRGCFFFFTNLRFPLFVFRKFVKNSTHVGFRQFLPSIHFPRFATSFSRIMKNSPHVGFRNNVVFMYFATFFPSNISVNICLCLHLFSPLTLRKRPKIFTNLRFASDFSVDFLPTDNLFCSWDFQGTSLLDFRSIHDKF